MQKPDEKTLVRIKVRIAERMGWAECGENSRVFQHAELDSCVWDYDLPDYTGSLDAIHEAEKSLLATEGQIETYMDALADVCGGDVPLGSPSFTTYFSEAWQRAVALDRTLSPEPIV